MRFKYFYRVFFQAKKSRRREPAQGDERFYFVIGDRVVFRLPAWVLWLLNVDAWLGVPTFGWVWLAVVAASCSTNSIRFSSKRTMLLD